MVIMPPNMTLIVMAAACHPAAVPEAAVEAHLDEVVEGRRHTLAAIGITMVVVVVEEAAVVVGIATGITMAAVVDTAEEVAVVDTAVEAAVVGTAEEVAVAEATWVQVATPSAELEEDSLILVHIMAAHTQQIWGKFYHSRAIVAYLSY